MGYGLLKLPLWATGVLAGVIWSLGMLVLPSARDSLAGVGAVLVGGSLFGFFMALVIRRQRRRLFAVGGRALSGPERVAVARAVHRGEDLPEGDLRVAARRYARLYRQNQRWWLVVVMVVVLGGQSVWLAVSDSPWWWIVVGLWPVIGAVLVWQSRRQQARVSHYLAA